MRMMQMSHGRQETKDKEQKSIHVLGPAVFSMPSCFP
jgi:hypothetical protein